MTANLHILLKTRGLIGLGLAWNPPGGSRAGQKDRVSEILHALVLGGCFRLPCRACVDCERRHTAACQCRERVEPQPSTAKAAARPHRPLVAAIAESRDLHRRGAARRQPVDDLPSPRPRGPRPASPGRKRPIRKAVGETLPGLPDRVRSRRRAQPGPPPIPPGALGDGEVPTSRGRVRGLDRGQ